MTEALYVVADVRDALAAIPDGYVDLVVTSPPFWLLRDYLAANDLNKHLELGREACPADYIDNQLALTAEYRRVLASHGSIAVEIGDTSGGSGGAGGDYGKGGMRDGQPKWSGSARAENRVPRTMGGKIRHDPALATAAAPADRLRTRRRRDGFPLDKSVAMIPEAYRMALAYGINPISGKESPAGQWLCRNTVTWCRTNPTPGRDGDKWRRATSDIAVACLSPNRYWDTLAFRTEPVPTNERAEPNGYEAPGQPTRQALRKSSPMGAPLLDWWVIGGAGYEGQHYATYPSEVPARLIETMCPHRVCIVCGKPSERVVEKSPEYAAKREAQKSRAAGKLDAANEDGHRITSRAAGLTGAEMETIGWTDCGHDAWRRGRVLDPFAGSGTTLQVATGRGRDAIGIDLDCRNLDLARERCGMFLREATLDELRASTEPSTACG